MSDPHHPSSRHQRIETILFKKLNPTYLLIENESNRHRVPANSETHFKVTAVSTQFENLSRINRHRLVNQLLALELNTGLHALSLHLFTPTEWDKSNQTPPVSPPCKNAK